MLRFAYIGNFGPEHSTENHVRQALERNGHEVTKLQENTVETWEMLRGSAIEADVVLWTRTGWDWPSLTGWTKDEADAIQRAAIANMHDLSIPVVGYHLDRWWGLNREGQVNEEPFFEADVVCTADGGHDAQWTEAGINHRWFPPGVSLAECERTIAGPDRQWSGLDVTFVGSWRTYHEEWVGYRRNLVGALSRRYRRRFTPLPLRGGLRGEALTGLYGTVPVIVGDSCLSGDVTNYCSDRLPETIGRGGFLVHPAVKGVTDGTLFTSGEHLATYALGDFAGLLETVDHYLGDEAARRSIAEAGRAHVMEHHTYEVRMTELVDMLEDEGWLK